MYLASCLFSTVKYGVGCFLLHNYLNAYHYDRYHSILIIGTYKSIYVISTIQILYQRLHNRIDTLYKYILFEYPSIANFFVKENENKSYVEFIHDGYANYVTSTNSIIKNNFKVETDIPFDFIIHSDCNFTTRITNKVILEDFKNKFVYDKSNVKFILAEMIIEDKIIKIDFQTDDYDYFIENNKFTHSFLVYFMKQHYYSEIKEFEDKLDNMTLKILDSDVLSETFDSKNILLICKEKYKKIVI
jgi:hypothetical protein